MVSCRVISEGPPQAAWRLLARPALWHRWAPHVRGARGLGAPEVEAGRRGAVLLGPGLPVALLPASITAVDPGRSWSWRVATVAMDHVVSPVAGGGCEIALHMRAAPPLELALRVVYAPIATVMLGRLAGLSER
jgi:hypothetical protein